MNTDYSKVHFHHRLEYAALRLAAFLLRLPPQAVAFRIGEGIGVLFSRVLTSRRRLVMENLSRAFPERKIEDIKRIASRFWRNLGRTAVEFVWLPVLMRQLRVSGHYDNADCVRRAMDQGHGIVFVASHFTNWEVTGVLQQQLFGDTLAVARIIKNPLVEAWVHYQRAGSGVSTTYHRQAVKACLRWLKEKKHVGILVDQNLYKGGVFVDFFGQPAASTTLPALLHLRTGAPVIHAYCLREGRGFRLYFEPISFPELPDDQEQKIVAFTQIISATVEATIRKYPQNWFWIHNRWKRKPEPAVAEAAQV